MGKIKPIKKFRYVSLRNKAAKLINNPEANHEKKDISSWMVKINKDKCKGCALCIIYCPFGCLELSSDLNKKGARYARIKKGIQCKGCGRCYLICPDVCVEIYKEISDCDKHESI